MPILITQPISSLELNDILFQVPPEVLMVATPEPVYIIEDNPIFGTIKSGETADLLLVESNPVAQISETQTIVFVVQQGR